MENPYENFICNVHIKKEVYITAFSVHEKKKSSMIVWHLKCLLKYLNLVMMKEGKEFFQQSTLKVNILFLIIYLSGKTFTYLFEIHNVQDDKEKTSSIIPFTNKIFERSWLFIFFYFS